MTWCPQVMIYLDTSTRQEILLTPMHMPKPSLLQMRA